MNAPSPCSTLSMGIEEEFFVVDAESGELASDDWQADFSGDPREPAIDTASEIFRAMIEVRTAPHQDFADLLSQQARNRYRLMKRLLPMGKALLACGTHPTADWRASAYGLQERYGNLLFGYGLSIERALTCGLHIHFGFADTRILIEAFNNIRPYLPFIAAVSTSSPFWQGRNTGVRSYRRAVFDALPRSGMPPRMETLTDYLAFCAAIRDPRYLSDATTIWWDARINLRHSTLEIRVPDTLPNIRRAQAIVLFSAICVELALSQNPLKMKDQYINENRWNATKFGLKSTMFFEDGLHKKGIEYCIDDLLGMRLSHSIMNSVGWSAVDFRRRLLDENDAFPEFTNGSELDECAAARHFLKHAQRLTGAGIMADRPPGTSPDRMSAGTAPDRTPLHSPPFPPSDAVVGG